MDNARRLGRRSFMAGTAAIAVAGLAPLAVEANAQAMPETPPGGATKTMPGGSNNYVRNAPIVENLGKGFTVSGRVTRADTGGPAANLRIQIWAATARGGEREPTNRGSVMTDANGRYRMEISPIVPQFGQPHIHMAYDDPGYATLFLRPVLSSRTQATMEVDIALAPDSPRAAQRG